MLSGFGAALAAFALRPTSAQAQSAAGAQPFQPAHHAQDEWMDTLPGKHRTVIDCAAAAAAGTGVFYANNIFTADRNGYQLADSDVAVSSAVRRLGRPRRATSSPVSSPDCSRYRRAWHTPASAASIPSRDCIRAWCPTVLGSVFARTVLMVTTLTSALALSSRSVLTAAGLDPGDPANVAALTLVVGVVMLVFGLLKFGAIMNFVSNAVMTGFTTGIAVQIIAGVIFDATAYKPQSHNTIRKFIEAFTNIGSWQPAPCLVAVDGGGVGHLPPRQAAEGVRDVDRARRGHRGGRAPPHRCRDGRRHRVDTQCVAALRIPNFDAIPGLLGGGLAVALVGLAQAAGISAAVPNPDGSRSNTSRDFTAQGVANLAGGFFGALPTGGSLSRTGVATSAGAQTRWAGIFAGVWLTLLVVVAGSLAELIPMPVIGGLIFVIGVELVMGRLARHQAGVARRAAVRDRDADHLRRHDELPLHKAILIGVITSLVLYCVKASQSAQLMALQQADGGFRIIPVPDQCASNDVTVLHYAGVGLFAEVARIDEEWPKVEGSTNAVVVLSMRMLPDVPSSVAIKALRRWAGELEAHGGRLIVAGVTPTAERILERGGWATCSAPTASCRPPTRSSARWTRQSIGAGNGSPGRS